MRVFMATTKRRLIVVELGGRESLVFKITAASDWSNSSNHTTGFEFTRKVLHPVANFENHDYIPYHPTTRTFHFSTIWSQSAMETWFLNDVPDHQATPGKSLPCLFAQNNFEYYTNPLQSRVHVTRCATYC